MYIKKILQEQRVDHDWVEVGVKEHIGLDAWQEPEERRRVRDIQ